MGDCLQRSLLNEELKKAGNKTELCDSCGVVSSVKKMHEVDLDGINFKLCERCRGKTKKYIERGCP